MRSIEITKRLRLWYIPRNPKKERITGQERKSQRVKKEEVSEGKEMGRREREREWKE